MLLDIAAERARRQSPPDVLRQYASDRFCAPGSIDAVLLARASAAALAQVASSFKPVVLSPIAPLGSCSALGSVPQNNLVTTMRLTDVVADPTNALALEAAGRRRDASDAVVRQSGISRVVRAQRFAGPRSFSHFSLLGLVSAGRDLGSRAFEVHELTLHARTLAETIRALDPQLSVHVTVSDHSGRPDEAMAVAAALAGDVDRASVDPERIHGVGYYEHLCVKIFVRIGDDLIEVGDGGSVPWTRDLVGSRKERLVISGLGLDRLADQISP